MSCLLSIVILTWNSLDDIKKCLESIFNNVHFKNYEIIIIDNGSKDGTADYLNTLKDRENTTIVFNDKNSGVAAGRNKGVGLAEGKYILILDVDTIVHPSSVDSLVGFMESKPDVGLAAPKLVDGQGNLQFTCRKYPTVMSKILRRIPLKWAKQRLKDEQLQDWDHNSLREVDYVIGACQLIKKSVFQSIGLYDEKIFYGPEDVDFCLRVWKNGFKVVYFPEAVITHDEKRVTKKKCFSMITFKHLLGLIYFFSKYKYAFSRDVLYSYKNQ